MDSPPRKKRFRPPRWSELAVALVCLLAGLVLLASLVDNDYSKGILAAFVGLVAAGQYVNHRVIEPRRQQRRREAALRSYLRELRQDCTSPPFPTSRRLRRRPDLYVEPSHLEALGGPTRPPLETPARDVEDALSQHEHVLLEGEPGVGKSAMLDRLVVRMIDGLEFAQRDGLVPVRVPVAAVAERGKPLSLALSDAINATLGMRLERVLEPDFFEQRPAADQQWLVVLDGLDELVGADRRAHFMRGVANNLDSYRFVIATRPLDETRALDEATRLARERFGWYRLPAFSKAQAKEFAGAWFRDRRTPASGTPPAEDLLRLLEESPFGEEIVANPLLLVMTAAEWEAHEKPLTTGRADLYERFVSTLIEGLEVERRAARAQVRREWARYGEDAERLADRLFDRRRRLLEKVALRHHQANPGDYEQVVADWVEEVVADWVREGAGKGASELLRRLDVEWLTEQAGNLLESTSLVKIASGRVEFFHETFGEYLVAAAFSTEHSPDEWPAWEFVARHWRDRRRQVVLFATGVWAQADKDMTELVTRLRHAMGGDAAAAVLADGAKVDSTIHARVVEDFLFKLWQKSANSSNQGLAIDLGIAQRLAKSPLGGHAVVDGLFSIAYDRSSTVAARAEVFRAIARVGHRDDAVEGLRALREETSSKAAEDPMAGFDSVQLASALDVLGEREEAVDILRHLGIRRREVDWSVQTESSVIGRMVRAEAARTLESLGERRDAIAILSEIARDPSSDPASRSTAAVSLEALDCRAQAVDVHTHIAQDSMELPLNRLNACEALDRLGERNVAVTVAGEIARDPQNPMHARADAARILHRVGEHGQAITALTQILASAPSGKQSGKLRFEAAKSLLHLGGPGERRQALHTLAQVTDDSDTLGYIRIQAAEALGKHDRRGEAIAFLRVFAERSEVFVWDRLRAAEALSRLGEHAGIPEVIREIMRDGEPSHRTSLLDHAATALDSITQPAEGIDALREVADDPAADGTLRVDAAEVIGWRGDLRLAIDFVMGLAQDPRSTAITRCRAAEAACTLGEYGQALPVLWEIVQADETDSAARRTAARFLADQDHLSIAAPRLFELCVKSDLPEEDRVQIARVLELAGHARILPAQQAIPILEAVANDPNLDAFADEGIESTLRVLREQDGIAILPRWVVDRIEDP